MGLARILVADPDSRSLALTVTGLRNAGFDVLSTSRGEEALALLQSVPAAIFCEVGVEGVDGFALCEAAHKAPATKDVPFFLMSRRDQPGYRERARAAGALDYLTKPLYLRDVCTLARLFASFKADSPLIREDLGSTPLFYVVRALTSGSLSGTVEVPHEKGVVHFRDGRVIDAVAGELKGEAAIGKLLMLAQGELTLRLGPVLVRGSMSYSLRDLISHDEPRRRRFERAVESMGGHEARLTIHFPTLARELPRLPPSVERIVRLFDGKRALGDVLRACDFDEVTAAETILRLFAMRVIRPAAELLSGPTTELPRLFEPRPDEAILAMRDLFPDAAPLPTEDVREGVPREVSDWLAELGKGTFQDILAVGTGGWLELPASQAGQQLREAIGELSDAEIENPLGALGALGSDAPPLDSAAAASKGESVAPDSIAAAVASAPRGEAEDKETATAAPSTPEKAEPAQASAAPQGEERDSPKASAEEPKPAISDASAAAPRETRDEGAPSPSGSESAQSNTDQQPAAARGDEDAKGPASEPSASDEPSEPSPEKQPAPGAAGLAQDLAAFCLEKLSGQATGPDGACTATARGCEAGGGAESPAAAAPAAEAVTALAAPAEPRSGEMGGARKQPRAMGAASGDPAQINAGADPAKADAPDEEAFFNSEPGFDEAGPPRPPSAMRVVLVFAALAFALVAVLLIVTPSKRRLPQGGQPLGLDPTPPAPAVATPAPEPPKPAALPGASAQQAAPDEGATAANAPPTSADSPASAAAAPTAPAAATPGEEEVPAALTAAADPAAQPVASGEVLDAPSAAAPEPAPEAQQKPEPRPGEVDELLAQGRQLYDRGQPKAALKPLERAAELAPDNSDIQVLLALARLDLGRLGPAEQAARRALELDASNARAHLVLGTVSQERGDTKRARSEYEEYLRLAPSGEHAKDVQAILSSMR